MRRPLLFICFSEAFGICLAYYTCAKTAAICMGLTAFLSLLLFYVFENKIRISAKQRIVFFLALVLFCVSALHVMIIESLHAPTSEEQINTFEGVATNVEIKKNYTAITLRTGSEKVLVRLDVTDDASVYDLVGRKVKVSGKTFAPDARRNPGGFDYRLYLKGKGIYKICKVSKYRLVGGRVVNPFTQTLSLAKGRFLSACQTVMSEEDFSIAAGIMFGEKGYMEDDLYEEFQHNGIAHVLAVSGLHVGLVYAVVVKVLKGRRNVRTSVITFIILLAYMALANFSVSVMRAGLMISLNLLSFHLRRRYDMVSAACLSAIVFMTANPYQLFDSGFQLSFMAAYSMGIILPWITYKMEEFADRRRSTFLQKLVPPLSICFAVQLGMSPLVAYNFLTFSVAGLFINPIAVALAGVLLPAMIALFCLFILIPAFLPFLTPPVEWLCKLFILLNKVGEFLGGAKSVCAPAPSMLLLYYICVFFFFSEGRYALGRSGKKKALAAVWSVLIAIGALTPAVLGINSIIPWDHSVAYVTFVDVGQGDCIHIHAGKKDVLIDGGGKYMSNIAESTLKPYLLKNGIRDIDLALITHMDGDHYKGIEELAEIYDVKKIAYPGTFKAGDVIELDDDIKLRVIWPKTKVPAEESGNDSSLVVLLEYKGAKLLLTGDIESDMAVAVRTDILKVAHHGSKNNTSPEFLKAAAPSFAVISCGKNNSYGHPSARVIELLEKSDIIYARTDLDGAICIRKITNNGIEIENAAKSKRWLIQTAQMKNTPLKPLSR